jgi:perosamine synthetase
MTDIRKDMLPVLRPVGGVDEVDALRKVIESGWWGKGPLVEQFEREFADMVGAKHAIAVTSATAGQDLVLKALDIKGADVVSPTLSFMTTAAVPLWNDCTSTLVDVDPERLCIDPEDVKRALTPNTRVVTTVNYAGIPAPHEEIRSFYDGFILEDCAHSCFTPGAGRGGDAAVWSFQATKTMPCGDGGMITTDDTVLFEKIIPLTWLGISSTYSRTKGENPTGRPGYSWDYDIQVLGYKAYMIDLTAAIALEQMKKLPRNLEIRRHVQLRYNEALSDVLQPPAWSETVQFYAARVDPSVRDELIDYLADKKIHTSVHYKPLHHHPIVAQTREFPVADSEWRRLISLPCHAGMTDDDIDYVIHWVWEFFRMTAER